MSADGSDALAYEILPVGQLIGMASPYNPRRISDHDLRALRRSMRTFGTVEPIVVNTRTGRIVGGHQRVKAAKAEGIEVLPVVHVDLDESKERQLNLALNRIAGEFDPEALAELLGELKSSGADLGITGFTDQELDDFLGDGGTDGLTDQDDVPDDAPARTSPGDVWKLGEHTLVCGDSRDCDVLRLSVVGREAACVWTDPPYGVSYVGKTADAMKIQNDDAEGLAGLLSDVFTAVDSVLAPGCAIYIAHPAGALSVTFGIAFLDRGWRLHQTLVWVKDSMVLGHSDYHYRHEPILFGYKCVSSGRRGRGAAGWYGPNNETSVFEVCRPKASREHPTSKPAELVERHVRNSSKAGDVVLDPFIGSGTTLIACESLDRVCAAVEIDPRYCDVAVARWEEFTGQTAQKES